MNYFDTVKGNETMEIIARSLARIADALEENNRLMHEAIRSGNEGKRTAAVSHSSAAKAALDELNKIV